MQLTYAPDEPQLFLLREKPKDLQIEPHAMIKMAQSLVSPSSISLASILFYEGNKEKNPFDSLCLESNNIFL